MAALRARRAKARVLEETRYRKWRFYRYNSKRPRAELIALRKKWWDLYVDARAQRKRLDKLIIALPITTVDVAGLDWIRVEEGIRLTPYNDSAGHATIGVGHLIHRGNVTAADRAKYRDFTYHDAMVLLDRDLDGFEKVVAKTFKGAKLRATQPRFNACVSLAFNIGTGGFASSSVARRIRVGDLYGAANAFLLWANPPELGPRRERERRLFLKLSGGR